jgi:hypothetical protein
MGNQPQPAHTIANAVKTRVRKAVRSVLPDAILHDSTDAEVSPQKHIEKKEKLMIEYTVQRIADAFTTDFYIDYI